MTSEVVHLTHQYGGGTQKYIDDLIHLFPELNHEVMNKPPYNFDLKVIKVLHIHATLVGEGFGWDVLRLVEFFKKKGVRVVLTVHDYQWLFQWCPNPTTEELETFQTQDEDVKHFKKLVSMCDVVFMHTNNVLRRYEQFCGKLDGITISVPCDVPVHYERSCIPQVSGKIRIGFLGGNAQHKGFFQFVDLARKMKCEDLEFHVYGSDKLKSGELLTSHGKYEDSTINEWFRRDEIHILMALSLSEETYCYALTHMINSGLPIVFLNRGSFRDRLTGLRERFFAVEHLLDLEVKVREAIEYVRVNQTSSSTAFENEPLKINKKYEKIYVA